MATPKTVPHWNLPMLRIEFDLPDFGGFFTWEGGDQEAAKVIAAARADAHHQGCSETTGCSRA
jgi:hypothetical protein